MAYKRRSSMIQGSRLHKEKLALNCSMDNTSGPDGRANSSAFQHNNHGGADFIENHFASGMHRTDGPMQRHTREHEREPENPNLNAELAKLMGYDRPEPTYEGTDEFRKKKDIQEKELDNHKLVLCRKLSHINIKMVTIYQKKKLKDLT